MGDVAPVPVHHEELAAAGILARVGHGDGAQLMLVGVPGGLALDLVAGPAGAGHALGAFPGVGAAALDDELGDHPVEGQAVIEALGGELDEIGHGAGSLLRGTAPR